MTRYAQHVQTHTTPQSEQARPDQVQNQAGGWVFKVDKWTQLDRFLVLGCEGNTYYATERAMTKDNAKNVVACLAEDGARAVARIVEISDAGRAPKNDPAIFALALAASDPSEATRKIALDALPKVCRIGTHLFHFADACNQLRGWGRSLRRAIAAWYIDRKPESLANQVLKYQQRDGWSHRDLLRLSHGAHSGELSPEHRAIFRWVVAGADGLGERDVKRKGRETVHYGATSPEALPAILGAYETMKKATAPAEVVSLIKEHGFTREMVPTQHLNDVSVWEALLEHMPLTAMIRNLGKMTAVGLINPLSHASKKVADSITDAGLLKKARVHPIALLSALKVYEQGHGERGKLTWSADRNVVDALNEGFYAAFDAIEPTGKRWLLGIDISGSMDGGTIAGIPGLTPRVAAAAMAMVTARTEKQWHAIGFTAGSNGNGVTELHITPKARLDTVIQFMQKLPMGRTDCAMPMLYAKHCKLEVDMFAVYTDNETYDNPQIHPFQSLLHYRQYSGIQSKMAVVGMTSTGFSIADPSDAGMVDFVGMDAAVPGLMADLARS
jgi:60 kDa SS-A/Ro ribonucleoprotein